MKHSSAVLILAGLSLVVAMNSKATEPAEIPFKLCRGYAVVVLGSIGETQDLNFLIDTGAVPSAVHARVARKLGLRGTADSISSLNQSVAVQRVLLAGVRLGPLSATSLPAVALDLSPIEQELGSRIDAIIGLDLLGRSSFTINYRQKRLRFGRVELAGPSVQFEVRHEARAPYVMVAVQVNGQMFKLLLDTGVNDLRLFTPRAANRLAGLRTVRTETNVNVAGEDKLRELELVAVRFGDTDLGRRKAFLWDTPVEALRDFDGLLGPAALGLKFLAFDFERKTLYWQAN